LYCSATAATTSLASSVPVPIPLTTDPQTQQQPVVPFANPLELNNVAVSLSRSGRYDDALLLLRQALDEQKVMIQRQQQQQVQQRLFVAAQQQDYSQSALLSPSVVTAQLQQLELQQAALVLQQQSLHLLVPAAATVTTAVAIGVATGYGGVAAIFSPPPEIYSVPFDPQDDGQEDDGEVRRQQQSSSRHNSSGKLSERGGDDMASSPSNYFTVFGKLFVFRDVDSYYFRQCCSSAAASASCLQLPTAVILYNMGLVEQKRALSDPRNDGAWARALELYGASLFAVEDGCRIPDVPPLGIATVVPASTSPDFSLLQLALFNNMGFIHSHFLNERETLACAGHLLSAFASVDCSRLLSKDEYVFYYMNLLLLLNRNPKFAPAA